MPKGAINLLYKKNSTVITLQRSPERNTRFKILIPKFRTWHMIVPGCINPRPPNSSADYINTNQKYMMYCLKKHKKLCLPFIILQYLRHIIFKSRTTTAGEGKEVPHFLFALCLT